MGPHLVVHKDMERWRLEGAGSKPFWAAFFVEPGLTRRVQRGPTQYGTEDLPAETEDRQLKGRIVSSDLHLRALQEKRSSTDHLQLQYGCSGFQVGAGPRTGREFALRVKIPSPRPQPCGPFGGRAGDAGCRGGAGSRQGPSTLAGRLGLGGSEEREPRGEGLRETKAPPGGRVGLCADTCISCLWVFVDLQSGTRCCRCLCVSVALRGCFAPVSTFAGLRLAVGVGGRIACVRIRGRCLPTCLGWVSTEGVRAESPTPPHLPAPPLSTRAHDLAPNFSPGSSGNSPSPPHRSPAGGAGSPPPPPPEVPGPQGAAMGLVVGGIGSAWGLAGQGLGGACGFPRRPRLGGGVNPHL
ncbi:PREDICTED: uncharacterized protein LOC108543189 [Rhinopithecus bieti]|uniref:uncharacterized protein LOC108543189 n=1 Tax=Rhinopithecus bieti TaxID=61621 RepID=UPI00083C540D|nr:PREDICTED: uncharacterized protein LOC108543189 [Rhinopithecus bieti]